jgi:tetratricopeptide (TPR) repeat protein
MLRTSINLRVASLAPFLLLIPSFLLAQQPKSPNSGAEGSVTPEKAITLAQEGRCKEAIPALKKVMGSQIATDSKKMAGVAGLRCALEFLRALGKQFPNDPDILFIVVHAYSDLSTRAAQDLARTAPESIAAHKLSAEAYETQEKWDEAEREYRWILDKQPRSPGIHYLLGRLLLVRPGADAKSAERAKEEFQKELQIDPNNAGAHYVLGEIAAKDEKWDEAITEFTAATKLDSTFADAYIGLGFTLVSVKRYSEAIEPLRAAERLVPQNPAVHYSLAQALERVGKREEADKELAIHQSLVSSGTGGPGSEKPQQ